MIVFEKAKSKYTLVGEVKDYYNGATGERTSQELLIYTRGPRGGRTVSWRGTIDDARDRRTELMELITAAWASPRRIKVKRDNESS